MNGTSLYELTGVFLQIQALAEDGDEQAFNDTLEAMNWNEDFENKCDATVMVIRNLEVSVGSDEGQIAAIKKILDDVKKSKAEKENKIKRLKENMARAMIAVEKPKFKTGKFSFWTQKTSEVVIDNETAVPLDYMTTPKPEISKTLIKEALKNGEKLPFAHIEEKETVRFK